MRKDWSVTYSIVTPESAEEGEVDEMGFILEGCTLRTGVEALFETRTSQVDGVTCIEPSCSKAEWARWITVHNGMEYQTGAFEERSLHIPEGVTEASTKRLVTLLSR